MKYKVKNEKLRLQLATCVTKNGEDSPRIFTFAVAHAKMFVVTSNPYVSNLLPRLINDKIILFGDQYH